MEEEEDITPGAEDITPEDIITPELDITEGAATVPTTATATPVA